MEDEELKMLKGKVTNKNIKKSTTIWIRRLKLLEFKSMQFMFGTNYFLCVDFHQFHQLQDYEIHNLYGRWGLPRNEEFFDQKVFFQTVSSIVV